MAQQLDNLSAVDAFDEIDPARPLDVSELSDAPSVLDADPAQSWPTVYDFDGYLPPEADDEFEELDEIEPLEVIEAGDETVLEAESFDEEEDELEDDSFASARDEERIDFSSYFGPLPSRPLSAPPDRTSIPDGTEDISVAMIPSAPALPSELSLATQLEADRLSELDTIVPPAATRLSVPPAPRRSRALLVFSVAAALAMGVGMTSYFSSTPHTAEVDSVIEVAAAPEIMPVAVEAPAFMEAVETEPEDFAPAEIAEELTTEIETAKTSDEVSGSASRASRDRADIRSAASSKEAPSVGAAQPSIEEVLKRSAAPTGTAPVPAAPVEEIAVQPAMAGPTPDVGTEEAPAIDLPAQPTREEVQAAIAGTLGAARDCAPSYRGVVVPTKITIAPSGRVTLAIVDGALAGTAEGSCIAKQLRKARTPAFSGPRLNVSYPIGL